MSRHWAQERERGASFFLTLTAHLVRRLPLSCLIPLAAAVSFYFYATAPRARRNIRRYHRRLQNTFADIALPKAAVWRQFHHFACAVSDRFAVWQGKVRFEDLHIVDPDHIFARMEQPAPGARGEIFLCSHHGNIDIARALVSHHRGFVLNVLVHSAHAVRFNRALIRAGADDIRLIQVTSLDPATMLDLDRRIAAGEWLAVAADRTPVRGEKTFSTDFLGTPAVFPQGPWLLAGLLQTRVNTLFCRKEDGRYRLHLADFADRIEWQRNRREKQLRVHLDRWLRLLEAECRAAPLQWFNFFDFWDDDSKKNAITYENNAV